tara:strand:+ start:666 stop:827 length:162 start_codon:yes stop_codon:yes gene_type:complete
MKIEKILEDIVETFNILSYHIKKLQKENKALKNQIDKLHIDLISFMEFQKSNN